MVIGFIGPNGSGKDTQAELAGKNFNVHHFSIGAVMREELKRGDELAREAATYTEKGNLVPDHITIRMMQAYIERNCPEGFLVTGFPRTVEQFIAFDEPLESLELDWDLLIHFDLDDTTAMERMQKQAQDAAAAGNPRNDATPEAMQKRLQNYHNGINPILTEAKSRGILARVDASRSIGEIQADVTELLSKL